MGTILDNLVKTADLKWLSKKLIFEASKFCYYFGVIKYVVMIVKFITPKNMKSFYDTTIFDSLESVYRQW